MSPSQLSAKVDNSITKFEKLFGDQVTRTQRKLLDEIQVLLNKLELNSDGTIIQNQSNRKILAKSDEYFNRAFTQSGYYDSLNKTTNTIGEISVANSSYFKGMVDGFTADAQYLKNLQKQTIAEMETLLANDGIDLMLKKPIQNILNQNINTGASITDLISQMRQFIVGNSEIDGQLKRYSKQVVNDTLFNYSRAFQESVSQNSGLKWTQYVGGITEGTKNKKGKSTGGSREFCLEKMGRYYEKSDVEKWANGDWAGKRRGTTKSTIFIYAGGYQCKHQIIYVSESAVPQTNKDAKALATKAKEVGDELQGEAKKIATKYGAKLTPINYKSYDSMVRKANDELKGDIGQIKDSVRNTIITDGKNIKNVTADAGKLGIKGLKTQDFSNSSGYRGYISNPKLSNGVIGEIQVNTPEMIYAKETPGVAKIVIGEDKWNEIRKKTGLEGGLGHKYYEEERAIVIDPDKPDPINDPIKRAKKDEILAKSRDYYKKFYYSYPEPWP